MSDYDAIGSGLQISQHMSESLKKRLLAFVAPLLVALDEQIDKRLVRSFAAVLQAVVEFRNRACGLLLSELGGYILTAEQAPAGTKRLSNLLRCPKWSAELIERFLWQRAEARWDELRDAGEEALLVWDESVLEKPESVTLEGLCAVRSRKAARLKRIKPGFFNPPQGRPVFVPGMHWVTVLVMGRQGPPTVAAMRWWSTRGKFASDGRSEEQLLLRQCTQAWGRDALHIWDRGFAGGPWLRHALDNDVRFVLRWPKGYKLVDAQGQARKAWQITRGKRSVDHRNIWDARRQCFRHTGLLFMPITHPEYTGQLFLVVSRPRKGRSPWYLLTNEPIRCNEDAWRVIFAYARRWQVEMSYRFGKSELAMESPRLWSWANRSKLLLIVTLVYSFLLSLLHPDLQPIRQWLLRHYCHRTGKRSRNTSTPLYRLRSALSRLWLTYPPSSLPLNETLG